MDHHHTEIQYTKLFINNTFVDAKNGKKYEVYNPTTGRVLCNIAEGDQIDVDYAVDCAKRVYLNEWKMMDCYKRGRLLYKLADLMEHYCDTIIKLECWDHGKPIHYVKKDLDYVIKIIRYYAGYADKFYGKTFNFDDKDYTCYTRCEAYGVVGLILSCTNPLLKLVKTFVPAFAAGNCLVIKPSYQCPLTTLFVAHLTKLAGFPDGVFNVITGGKNVGRYIVTHRDIYKLTFHGQTKNGKDVMETVGRNYMKNLTMKLGSNNALVVFKDYDLDHAVKIAYHNLFYNQGQNTGSCHRVYVHEDVYDDYVKRIVDMVRKRKIGDVFDTMTEHGPQVDEYRMNKILNLIDIAKKEGGRLECGGKRYGNTGYYIEPTVISNCHDTMRCAMDELYGPILYIFKFKNVDDVIERLNKCYYGYAVGILTHFVDYYDIFAKKLHYANIWFNDYFTTHYNIPLGRFKETGWGYDYGVYGLYEYLVKKTVTYKNKHYHYDRDYTRDYHRDFDRDFDYDRLKRY